MKKILTHVLFLIISLLPITTLAAPATYDLLAPIGTLSGKVTLTEYLQGVLETAVGITGVLAVIMIVVCGIRLMGTGSVAGRSEAKECILNAIFGILLVIGSWLLLNTINPLLLKNTAQLSVDPAVVSAPLPPSAFAEAIPNGPGWYFRYKNPSGRTVNSPRLNTSEACLEMQKVENTNGTTITDECFEISKPAFGAPLPAPSASIPPPTQPASEKATRNALCGNDSCVINKPIGIKKNACIPYNASYKNVPNGCTNVGGTPAGTVSFIKSLPGLCSCDVVITGGTEAGHTSHASGLPIFDLRLGDKLYPFIKANATIKANPSFCYSNGGTCFSKWLYNGYWFTDENDHWHICKDGTSYTGPEVNKVDTIKKACNKL